MRKHTVKIFLSHFYISQLPELVSKLLPFSHNFGSFCHTLRSKGSFLVKKLFFFLFFLFFKRFFRVFFSVVYALAHIQCGTILNKITGLKLYDTVFKTEELNIHAPMHRLPFLSVGMNNAYHFFCSSGTMSIPYPYGLFAVLILPFAKDSVILSLIQTQLS